MTHPPTETLHVAMLGSMPPTGGISAYCLELARAVARRTNVDFMAFRRLYPAWLHPAGRLRDESPPDVAGPRLRVHRQLTWYNPFGWLWHGLRTPGRLLHAQWWSWPLGPAYVAFLLMAKLRGRPVVLTMHNVSAHEDGLLPRLMDRLVLRLADHVIVHSRRNAEQLRRKTRLPVDRISRIPHGVLGFFAEGAPTARQARRRLGIAPDRRTLLFFGSIRPYKGLDVLLEAVAKLAGGGDDLLLLIAGKPWGDRHACRRQIDALGLGDNVRLHLDFVPADQVAPFFQAAELVVLPYRHFESQTGVGSLALAFAKPMIVTNVGALPDLVDDPRCVVPPDDPDALAEAVRRCLRDPDRLRRMAEASRRIARTCGWDEIADRTVELYRRLLAP